VRGRCANYRAANPEIARIRQKICDKAYRKANPGKINAKTALRRARKLQATPKWLTKEQKKEIQKFYIEAAEITKETGISYEVDHIMPLKGKISSGLHVPWNLQILTKSENGSKSNRTDND